LLVGNVDACGVSQAGIRLVEGQMGVKFKEIGQSPSIPHALFVARGGLPPAERRALKRVLAETSLDKVPSEYRAIFVTPGQKPFRQASDRDYDPVRRHLRTIKRR
jgi:ABC-type phosphate/phosphonate transport system substrate-binding protein